MARGILGKAIKGAVTAAAPAAYAQQRANTMAKRDEKLRSYQQADTARRETFQTSERVAGQEFRAGETTGAEEFKTTEREAGEEFRAEESELERESREAMAELKASGYDSSSTKVVNGMLVDSQGNRINIGPNVEKVMSDVSKEVQKVFDGLRSSKQKTFNFDEEVEKRLRKRLELIDTFQGEFSPAGVINGEVKEDLSQKGTADILQMLSDMAMEEQ